MIKQSCCKSVAVVTGIWFLILGYNNAVLAHECPSNDLECQKVTAMKEAGITSLATKKEKISNTNNESGTFEFFSAPTNTTLEQPKAINGVNNQETGNEESRREASADKDKNALKPITKIESLIPTPIPTSGKTPEIKPIGGNTLVINDNQRPAPNIYMNTPTPIQTSIYK